MSSASPGTKPAPRPEDDVIQLSFEDALAELDQIVRGLEGGALKLDAAVQAFERGVKLRRHCEAKLAEVEARVEALVRIDLHGDMYLSNAPRINRSPA